MIIGYKERFAFSLGKQLNEEQRVVDIFVRNLHLTDFDNLVYIPQFIATIQDDIELIESKKIPKEYSALFWGPTTDDVSCRLTIRNSEDIQLHCKHRSGRKVTLNIKTIELVELYKNCIYELTNAT